MKQKGFKPLDLNPFSLFMPLDQLEPALKRNTSMTNRSPIISFKGTLFSAGILLTLFGCGKPDEPKTEAPTPKFVSAQIGTVEETNSSDGTTVTGTVKPLLNSVLASKVMGRVVAVHVREGDVVKTGQLLAEIDSRELQSAVNVANATYHASMVGVESAKTTAVMEEKTTRARIGQAESQVKQAESALAAAEARRDLAVAGPRQQEVAQSHIAVIQAASTMKLAKLELERATKLVHDGALAGREQDIAQNRFDLAKGQYDAAVQGERIAKEGTRSQEIRAAEDLVRQASGALKQAMSAVNEAKAAALQVEVRRKQVDVAKAQVAEASASVQSAQVGLSYSQVVAPFDGRISQRLVDPGAMASVGVPILAIQGGEYRLEAVVPEGVLQFLPTGFKADADVAAASNKAVPARLAEIVPQGDPTSRSFLVRFTLGTVPSLKAGMYGTIHIKTGAVKRLLIPRSASWERDGLRYVYAVGKDGIARLRIVTSGESIGDRIEVLSGLGKGDRIVTSQLDQVADGNRVEAK